MSRIKTIICAASFGLILSGPTQAQLDLSQEFAGCIGRYSAEREHAWLVGGENEEHLETQRQTFLTLLDATAQSAEPVQTLAYRVEVKMAHASLLTVATFGSDTVRAARAQRLAADHLKSCQNLLLDS